MLKILNKIKDLLKKNYLSVLFFIIFTLLFIEINKVSEINEILTGLNKFLIETSIDLGIFGAFIITVIGNSTLFFPLPYMIPIIFLATEHSSIIYIIILTIVSAIGMVLGETLSYYLGVLTGKLVLGDDQNVLLKKVKDLLTKNPRTAPFLIVLFAATPLPDDVLILALSLIKYDIKKIPRPMFFGKLYLASVYTFGGHYFFDWFSKFSNIDSYSDNTFIIYILSIILLLFIVRKVKERRFTK